jgi:hypothetical protein
MNSAAAPGARVLLKANRPEADEVSSETW